MRCGTVLADKNANETTSPGGYVRAHHMRRRTLACGRASSPAIACRCRCGGLLTVGHRGADDSLENRLLRLLKRCRFVVVKAVAEKKVLHKVGRPVRARSPRHRGADGADCRPTELVVVQRLHVLQQVCSRKVRLRTERTRERSPIRGGLRRWLP